MSNIPWGTVAWLAIPIAYLLSRWLRPRPIAGIPHYPVTSIWGDLPALGADSYKHGSPFDHGAFIPSSQETLGPIFQVFFGPFRRSLMLNDAQECEDVLLRSASKLELADGHLVNWGPILPTMQISLKTDSTWRRHRRAIHSLMSPSYLGPVIGAAVFDMAALWRAKSEIVHTMGGTCFNFQEDFGYSSSEVMVQAILGKSPKFIKYCMDQLSSKDKAVVRPLGEIAFPVTPPPLLQALRYVLQSSAGSEIIPIPVLYYYKKLLVWRPGFQRQRKVITDYIDDCLEDSRRNVQESQAIGEELRPAKCLVDMFAQAEVIEEAEFLPEDELKDELIGLLLAGYDTVATSLRWGVKYLTAAPEVQRRLHAELMTALEDEPDKRPLTYNDVSSDRTPYLEAVVHEILRCARVAVATRRQTKAPITILGYDVPEGTDIFFNINGGSNHATPDKESELRALDTVRSESSRKNGPGKGLFMDTELFHPDRWLDKDGKFDAKAGFSAPFGLGIRACAGKPLALLELRMFIATLNLAFFFDKVPDKFAGFQSVQSVIRAPTQVYVNPKSW